MVAVPGRVSIVPSPQTTTRPVTVPSGSWAEMVRVIDCPVEAVVADSVKPTTGGWSTAAVTVMLKMFELDEWLVSPG